MKAIRNTLAVSLLSTIAILAGCGGGAPSLDDVQNAMLADITESMAAAQSMGMKINVEDMIKVKDVKDCEETRKDIYQCTVEATVNMFGVSKTDIHPVNLTKNSEGQWRVVQ